jgi:hypothetical protein
MTFRSPAMPEFSGFIAGGYQNRSTFFDGERCVNMYEERAIPGSSPKTQKFLMGTPGLKLFATLPTAPNRGFIVGDNNLFATGGSKLYQVLPNGTVSAAIGDIGFSAGPIEAYANLASNQTQTLIVSGNVAYIIGSGAGGNFASPVPISSFIPGFPAVVHAAYIDGFFVVQAAPTQAGMFANQFFLSGPNDGTVWDLSQFATKSAAPDALRRIFVDHDLLWLLGSKTTEVWYNAGAAPFPLAKYPGAAIEVGIYADSSICKLDNSMFWLGSDDRGFGIVYRAQGFLPLRISNHAVETAIQSYPDAQFATGYAYQEEGHQFYRLDFPQSLKTWVYDVATNSWHERAAWNPQIGQYQAHWGRFHTFTMGQHFVGDYRNGNIYVQSLNYLDDAGTNIRRLRSSPHLSNQMTWQYYNDFWVDMAVGLPRGAGVNIQPQAMMRMSNDGGQTWGNEHWVTAGALGKYKSRVRWRRLGRSRDRCFEVVINDAIPVQLLDAYLDVTPGDGS